ncbi:MAG: class I SAM-dependent methyltransferase [Pelolinea sp.]|nr:class I SAM-dependent methyltransferase [Pelolinea sp.]
MDKQVSRQFFNQEAAHWDETVRNNDADELRALAERLSIQPDARVLDVGTGTGVFIPYIKSKLNGGGRVLCVDFAFKMLEIAQKKNGCDGVDHVCVDIETVRFADHKFDTVVCYSAFPHFHDKPLALENIFEVLTNDGVVYICHSASREFINNIHRKMPDFSDHLIPEKGEMFTMLGNAGFFDISITEDDAYYLAQATKMH